MTPSPVVIFEVKLNIKQDRMYSEEYLAYDTAANFHEDGSQKWHILLRRVCVCVCVCASVWKRDYRKPQYLMD